MFVHHGGGCFTKPGSTGLSPGSRGGGSFVGTEGGVQSYRAQGLAQLLLTVPTLEYPHPPTALIVLREPRGPGAGRVGEPGQQMRSLVLSE